MISFYSHSDNCYQLRFGNITIYYSFKFPVAYKSTMHGLVIQQDAFNGNWGEITTDHIKNILISHKKYILSEKEVFDFNLKDQIKRTILQMAKDITCKGLKIC